MKHKIIRFDVKQLHPKNQDALAYFAVCSCGIQLGDCVSRAGLEASIKQHIDWNMQKEAAK